MYAFFALVFGLLACLVAAPVLTILGIRAVVRSGRVSGRADGVRAVALLSAAGAVVAYLWGAVNLLGAVLTTDDSGADAFPIRPCREGGIDRAETVVDHRVSFLPLRYTCVRRAGGDYAVAVPGYVNPLVSVLGVSAVVGGTYAVVAARRTGRRQPVSGAV